MTSFKINQAGIDAIGKKAVDAFNAKMQPVMDQVHRDMSGRPVDEVSATIIQRWHASANGHLPEPQLMTMANAISNGQRVDLRNGAR